MDWITTHNVKGVACSVALQFPPRLYGTFQLIVLILRTATASHRLHLQHFQTQRAAENI